MLNALAYGLFLPLSDPTDYEHCHELLFMGSGLLFIGSDIGGEGFIEIFPRIDASL